MKTRSTSFQTEKETKWETVGEGMRRQILGYDGQIMMVKVAFEKGAIGAMHDHFHSQVTYVSSGKFEVTIGEEKKILDAGDGFYAEPDLAHGVLCLEAGILIDVFTPHRADFINK